MSATKVSLLVLSDEDILDFAKKEKDRRGMPFLP